jgi:hypothetical protein
MENALLIITISSLGLNAFLVVSIMVFLFKTMNHQKTLQKLLVKETDEQKVIKVAAADAYCVDHPTEVSTGVCTISMEAFCQHCLKEFGSHRIGKRHLNIYLNNEWEEFMTLPIDDESELSKKIIDMKKHLWSQKQKPVIVERHFKIDVTDDEVEVFTILKGRKEELEELKTFFIHLLNQN